MFLKSTRHSLSIILYLISHSSGGLLSLEEAGQQRHYGSHQEDISPASSFMHFHGPVEGPEYEVKVPHVDVHQRYPHSDPNQLLHEQDHDGYALDYIAHPKYQFSYGVEDHHTGDFHSQKETRDGSSVSGEYSVLEPGGGVRVVSYRADKDGFRAVVRTTGKNEHSGGTYGYRSYGYHQAVGLHGLQQPEEHSEEQQLLREYAASFPLQEEEEEGEYR